MKFATIFALLATTSAVKLQNKNKTKAAPKTLNPKLAQLLHKVQHKSKQDDEEIWFDEPVMSITKNDLIEFGRTVDGEGFEDYWNVQEETPGYPLEGFGKYPDGTLTLRELEALFCNEGWCSSEDDGLARFTFDVADHLYDHDEDFADEFPEPERTREEWTDIFNEFGGEGYGWITTGEFSTMYRTEFPEASNEEVQAVFDEIDLENPDDDMLTEDEFLNAIEASYGFAGESWHYEDFPEEQLPEEEWLHVFNEFGGEGYGWITTGEFSNMYRSEFPEASDEECQAVFDQIDIEDPDADMLTWDEFRAAIEATYGFADA